MSTPFLSSQLEAHSSSKLAPKPLRRISTELSLPQQELMNPITRFFRFNLVGLLGIGLQLATLAMLNRAIPNHYLLTSTLAVEITLLHNFILHVHYTWPETTSPLIALLRFHLSNGLISLAGNIALMHLFVHSLHAPILLANTLTIAICGLANFLLAHHWAFAIRQPENDLPKNSQSCLDKP
jgi:putative flippase GtrA